MTAADLRAKYKPAYTLKEVLDFCVSRAEDSQRAVFDAQRWAPELTEALEEEGFTITEMDGVDAECVIVSWALPPEPIPAEVDPAPDPGHTCCQCHHTAVGYADGSPYCAEHYRTRG